MTRRLHLRQIRLDLQDTRCLIEYIVSEYAARMRRRERIEPLPVCYHGKQYWSKRWFPSIPYPRPIDPARPVTSLKTAWESTKAGTGVKCRLHDRRHTFCTKLAEADTPESTMLDMMGHVSAAMLRRYSHIRAKARREAISAIETRANSVGVPKEPPKVERPEEDQKPVTRFAS